MFEKILLDHLFTLIVALEEIKTEIKIVNMESIPYFFPGFVDVFEGSNLFSHGGLILAIVKQKSSLLIVVRTFLVCYKTSVTQNCRVSSKIEAILILKIRNVLLHQF